MNPTIRIALATTAVTALAGCASQGYSVVATTSTTIGVGLAQQATSAGLDATLGYKRAEFALVPTDRPQSKSGETNVTGADRSADVIMELRYSGIFSAGENSGIYQRLAIGTTAVQQRGATYMFAKGNRALDPAAIEAINKVPSVQSEILNIQADIVRGYQAAQEAKNQSQVAAYDKAFTDAGFKSFSEFIRNTKPEGVARVRDNLKAAGISF